MRVSSFAPVLGKNLPPLGDTFIRRLAIFAVLFRLAEMAISAKQLALSPFLKNLFPRPIQRLTCESERTFLWVLVVKIEIVD